MAFRNTEAAASTGILHANKKSQTKPVGRLISGCDGPTERISAFVDKLIQPFAKIQKSYIKDTTDFILQSSISSNAKNSHKICY